MSYKFNYEPDMQDDLEMEYMYWGNKSKKQSVEYDVYLFIQQHLDLLNHYLDADSKEILRSNVTSIEIACNETLELVKRLKQGY